MARTRHCCPQFGPRFRSQLAPPLGLILYALGLYLWIPTGLLPLKRVQRVMHVRQVEVTSNRVVALLAACLLLSTMMLVPNNSNSARNVPALSTGPFVLSPQRETTTSDFKDNLQTTTATLPSSTLTVTCANSLPYRGGARRLGSHRKAF